MELSIPERLKDLRVERGLTLEQLAEQTHLSKSALGSYEGDNSLLCELATHPDFPRLMADLEIYVNGIATKQVQSANAIVDAVSATIMKQHNPGLTDPQLRQLITAHIDEDSFCRYVIQQDMNKIALDLREAHKDDFFSVPEDNPLEGFLQAADETLPFAFLFGMTAEFHIVLFPGHRNNLKQFRAFFQRRKAGLRPIQPHHRITPDTQPEFRYRIYCFRTDPDHQMVKRYPFFFGDFFHPCHIHGNCDGIKWVICP